MQVGVSRSRMMQVGVSLLLGEVGLAQLGQQLMGGGHHLADHRQLWQQLMGRGHHLADHRQLLHDGQMTQVPHLVCAGKVGLGVEPGTGQGRA